MKYLKDKLVYLAGPIHACSDDGMGWRESITPKLLEYGLQVEDPCKKTINGFGEVKDDKKKLIDLIKNGEFGEAKKLFYPIVRKDLRCIDRADFVIVVYDPTVHMFGTIHELVVAHNQRKPILLWFDKNNIEKFNPWCLTLVKEGCIFTEWEAMYKYLDEINKGIFNTSYWTI